MGGLRHPLFPFLAAFLLLLLGAQGQKQASTLDHRIPSSNTEIRLDLGGEWLISNKAGDIVVPGEVPGEVHVALTNQGILEDPYYGKNDVEQRWVALDDWTFSSFFEADSQLLQQQEIFLVCYGVDTISTIVLNGQTVGTTDNQFRRYMFPIKGILVFGLNTIEVQFESAGTYATQKAKEYPYPLNESTSQEDSHGELFREFIRKESCSFAWDWGPCFLPQGIWKPIEIIGHSSAMVLDVYPQVFNPEGGVFTVLVSADVRATASLGGSLKATVAGFSGQASFSLTPGESVVTVSLKVPASSIELWWPAGYGKPVLYDLQIDFSFNDGTAVSETKRIGFRTAELVEDPYSTQTGQSFYFRINGVPVWSKGSNLIPLDVFESRVTNEDIDRILLNALEANMNTVRIWGGGVYQVDYLYDQCDELGLMVWEEFMFACALYPSDKEFLATVKEEVKTQVKRLMHHVSIVIWSGNNENQQAITEKWFPESIRNPHVYTVDYDRLYHLTIRETLLQIDSSRKYLSSSPSNGVIAYEPFTERWITDQGETSNSQMYGDNHYYNYRNDCEDVSKMVSPRFSSEYGFQSMPSFITLRPISSEQDWTWDSDLMKFRNHRTGDGQVDIYDQMTKHFLFPANSDRFVEFLNFIYLSQATQALCYRAQTEHYRRSKTQAANTMGALYWQLNDIWQASTWSSLEYGGRWKMVHYYVKNFFSPVIVSSYKKAINVCDVHVTSDVTSSLSGTVNLEVWNFPATRVNVTTIPFTLDSLGSKSILEIAFLRLCTDLSTCVVVLKLNAVADATQEQYSHRNFFFPAKPKDVTIPKASVTYKVVEQAGNSIFLALSSNVVAPFTFAETEIKGRFSDNGMMLLPNETFSLEFIAWEPTTVEQFLQTFTLKTLSDALPSEQ